MAGDYVPMDHSLPDKPEFLAILQATGEAIEVIFFRLWKLWRMADGQTLNGKLIGCGPRALAFGCGGSEEFWLTVAKVTASEENPLGWLQFQDGDAVVPGFCKRFRKSAKQRREESRKQKAAWRESKRQNEQTSPRQSGMSGEKDVKKTWKTTGHPQDKPPDKAPPEPEPEPISEQEPISEPEPKNQDTGFAGAKPRGAATPRLADSDAVNQDLSREVLAVFDHYRSYHPKSFPKPKSGSKEWAKIRARLDEGYTAEQLFSAINGCHHSPWHCGENPGGKLYQSLELIVRDASHVNQFSEIPVNQPVLSEKEQRGRRAAKSWIERARSCETQTEPNSPF